jgi:hypothetical protein
MLRVAVPVASLHEVVPGFGIVVTGVRLTG